MKSDINLTLNKLVSYALDNLLLDALDDTYTFNRLATVCGVAAPVRDIDADYGNQTLEDLIGELTAVAPSVDKTAVVDILFPMPRTVNYYFANKLSRDTNKALDFLFDLYAHGYNNVSKSAAIGKNGYLGYACGDITPMHAATLFVGEELVYTPRVIGNHIATLEKPDILTEDILSRESTFALKYGGAIATRIGSDAAEYYCCDQIALTSCAVKKELSTGAVKTSLLDYPVPALAFNGIAKNTVIREVMRIIKAANESDLSCVVAAAPKDGVTFYLVFADPVKASEFVLGGDALAACGVFETVDCAPLLPVLEKGTALSTDIAAFRPIYDVIGGVKHGAKATQVLGGALTDLFIPLLKAAASAAENQVTALAETRA
ncbi:MAG: hypothetical protein J1G01_07075 [Clostridiales bacterium]|nr:hypothetical protein [Clostridiales bacterium]